jgi:hypothetical protein
LTLQSVKSEEAAEALQILIRYIEQLEEYVRRSRMPEVALPDEELKELREAEHEMDNKGASLTLAEFNKRFSSAV